MVSFINDQISSARGWGSCLYPYSLLIFAIFRIEVSGAIGSMGPQCIGILLFFFTTVAFWIGAGLIWNLRDIVSHSRIFFLGGISSLLSSGYFCYLRCTRGWRRYCSGVLCCISQSFYFSRYSRGGHRIFYVSEFFGCWYFYFEKAEDSWYT